KPMGRFSAYAGAVALAVLMIPTITKTTDELLKLVPNTLREAALALGAPQWIVNTRIVLSAAAKGIVTAVMLSVARVAGETAPLLFTAMNNRFWHNSLDQPIASLPVQIYTYATSPYDDWHAQAWAGATVLIVIVFVLSVVVRVVSGGKFTVQQ
ncbi:MAG: PstA family ABC transporter permease, partial [Candidatus Kapaibacterium sp.]